MAGTREGGLKTRERNLAKNPNYYRDLGRAGGCKSRGGGFTFNPELARRAGAIGGAKSRRRPKKAQADGQQGV